MCYAVKLRKSLVRTDARQSWHLFLNAYLSSQHFRTFLLDFKQSFCYFEIKQRFKQIMVFLFYQELFLGNQIENHRLSNVCKTLQVFPFSILAF